MYWRPDLSTIQTVHNRHVFYVPGYDPMPPRRYRELYRVEGAKQAEISGYDLSIKGSTGQNEKYHWNVKSQMDGQSTDSRIEFMVWNDIVFDSMKITILHTYWLLLRTLWLYVSSGTLMALYRLRRAPMIAALYPVVALGLQILLSLGAAKIIAAFVPGIIGTGLAMAVFCGLLVMFRRLDDHFLAYYLMHDFAFWGQDNGEMPKILADRVDSFSARICEALDSDVDEVLIVGHSSGAHLAVALVAEVLRRRTDAPKLSLLTLGQALPVVSFLPDAWDLRRDLHQVSKRSDLTWVDVSAPGDGACFALSDPVAVSGVAPIDGEQFGPMVMSAAFTKTLSPEALRESKWKFFRRHIQYLRAFDRPLDYDYFRITAGPKSLKARFAGRTSSKSMVTEIFTPSASIAPKNG